MNIKPVLSYSSSVEQRSQRQYEYSQTDWKTYMVVVCSNLLIIAGMVLACASLYFLTVVHPMLAMGSPIVLTAAGVLGVNHTVSQAAESSSHSSPANENRFLGMVNKSGTHCWEIAVLQALFNTEEDRKRLQNIQDQDEKLLSHSESQKYYNLLPLIDAMMTYDLERQSPSHVCSVDTEHIHKCLYAALRHKKNGPLSEPPEKGKQEDAWELMKFYLDQSNTALPPFVESGEVKRKDGSVIKKWTNVSGENGRTPLRYFEFLLGIYEGQDHVSLDTLFQEYFHRKEITGNNQLTINSYFRFPPKSFKINLNRVSFIASKKCERSSYKIHTKVHFPLKFAPGPKDFGKNATYECRYIISHIGDSPHGGHYVTFLKGQNGKWYFFNDSLKPKEVSLDRVKREIDSPNPYIIHYQRIA